VDPSRNISRLELRKIDEHIGLYVIGLVMGKPSFYLGEICQEIIQMLQIEVSPSLLCRLLKRYGMTRKKIRQVAKQRSESLRGGFRAQTFLFRREMFVWVDETGTDRKDNIRKFGYSLRATPPECHRILCRGERLNAITALSSAGIVAVEFTKQTVTGEAFFDFLRGILIPRMRPFNGINPRSVLVLDNCTVHHVQDVKDLLQQVGIVALFLPPYSPDLMPLEEAFSFVKYYLKKHDESLQTITNPIDVIRAVNTVMLGSHMQGTFSIHIRNNIHRQYTSC